ncbi:rhodanese-like domain-containing protein [Alishewanella sp. SMS8]|uniref:rhodanese-like domain-containing protein n=1 Tax=Alishewanella sp. SMS8 TaxID=2994676 RepID=UPI002740712F|nr:rhodanese-like domain-containing protein [Alishewanella sp. SMS8]MDP5206851.1 rhodanese-like domain-containing protein [Alishewanella sp. SMS9]MDP5459790.1 rhodanese-like domain-containing protein [Alishewanella sp. SMS8]
MSFHSWLLLPIALSVICFNAPSLAQDSTKPLEQVDLTKSQLGLYLTAKEAYQLLENDPKAILVDVRDPVEIKFTGFAQATKVHVPFQLTDASLWNEQAQSWAMRPNPHFDQELLQKLNQLGVAKDANIIMMCRSGSTRSAPAADRLAVYGYSKVWSVSDGFEGTTEKTGLSKGVRKVDGWRNSGLPWSYKIPEGVAWKSQQ